MRLANLAGRATLVCDGDRAVDVFAASSGEFGPDLVDVYDRWEPFTAWARDHGPAAGRTLAEALDPALLGPPSPEPRQVFGIGMNYHDHAAEIGNGLPETPSVFTKYPSCLTGPYGPVPLVDGSCDWEVELVLVVGRRAFRVPRGQGWSHVAGVTVGQDISERSAQTAGPMPQFSLAKSHPGFGPTGPFLVTVDELDDPDDIELGCRLNGVTVQTGSTRQLIFPVDELVHRLSSNVTLYPGDLIFTGTPGGVGAGRTPPRFLADGDVVESWIAGVGSMRNVMRAQPV